MLPLRLLDGGGQTVQDGLEILADADGEKGRAVQNEAEGSGRGLPGWGSWVQELRSPGVEAGDGSRVESMRCPEPEGQALGRDVREEDEGRGMRCLGGWL